MTTPVSENSNVFTPEQDATNFEKAFDRAMYYEKRDRTIDAKEACQNAFDEANYLKNGTLKSKTLNFYSTLIKGERALNVILYSLFTQINKASIPLDTKKLEEIERMPAMQRNILVDDFLKLIEENGLCIFAYAATKEECSVLFNTIESLLDIQQGFVNSPISSKIKLDKIIFELRKLNVIEEERFPLEKRILSDKEDMQDRIEMLAEIPNEDTDRRNILKQLSISEEDIRTATRISVPTEEEKPVEEKPVEEEKPVVEEKPVEEEKPVVEEKPVEEEKPVVEEKPVEEEKPVDQTKPKMTLEEEINLLKEELSGSDMDYARLFSRINEWSFNAKTPQEQMLAYLKSAFIYHAFYKNKNTSTVFYLQIAEKRIETIKKLLKDQSLDKEFVHFVENEVEKLEKAGLLFSELTKEASIEKRESVLGFF